MNRLRQSFYYFFVRKHSYHRPRENCRPQFGLRFCWLFHCKSESQLYVYFFVLSSCPTTTNTNSLLFWWKERKVDPPVIACTVHNWPAQDVHGKRPSGAYVIYALILIQATLVFEETICLFSSFLALLMMLLTCSMFAQVNVRSFCGDQYPINTFCADYG